MPQISYFFGIAIYMYYADHAPPHFHAEYGEDEAVYRIDTLELLRGKIAAARSWPCTRMGVVTS
jgi:hypothetical protein